jgi:hypothetical protein
MTEGAAAPEVRIGPLENGPMIEGAAAPEV